MIKMISNRVFKGLEVNLRPCTLYRFQLGRKGQQSETIALSSVTIT